MYFLAIVAKSDLLRGRIVPSYTLCVSHGTSENRSPYRVYKANSTHANAPKVLVSSIHDQKPLIDFLSNYRTRIHMHKARYCKKSTTQKYYPEGALFWFPCNEYGEQIDAAIFVKTVPDSKAGLNVNDSWTNLKAAMEHKPTCKELFTATSLTVPLLESCKRLTFIQSPKIQKQIGESKK